MAKLINYFVKQYNFIRYGIWRISENELSKSNRFYYRLIKTSVIAIRGFINEDLVVKASALTYSILFAIVPFFALIIAIGKGFHVDKMIENSLQDSFIGQEDMVPTIMGFVERYLQTTQGGLFIGIGIAILFWSVMNFFRHVEKAFNSIWQVKKSRSIFSQFAVYFSAILIIPLLIVFSGGLSIFVSSSVKQSYVYEVLSPLLRFGMKLIPYFINWVVFSVLYKAMPNTRVKIKNAIIAGVVAGSAFQAFQMLYINGQVYLSRYNVVYGSFAAVPLLILWIQISCLIILLGAEISYASQNVNNFDFELDTNNISTRYKNFLTLFLTYVIVKQFENQQPPLTTEQIVSTYKLPIRLANEITTKLVSVNILTEILNTNTKIKTYQPAIDINQLTVNILFNRLESSGSELFLINKNKLLDSFWHKTLEIKQQSDSQTTQLLVKDL